MNRRSVLRAAGVGLAGFAGCGERQDAEVTTRATRTRATTTGGVPYRGDAERVLSDAKGVVVRNRGESPQFVTVAVYDAGRAAFSRTFEVVAGSRVRVGDAVAAPGTYRVVVETAGGSRETGEWRVTAGGGDLAVVVEDGVTLWAVLRCAPSCSAAVGGESAGLPYKAGATGREPATMVVENAAAGRRRVSVTVANFHATVLDYEYAVPAGTRLRIPVTSAPGAYAVRARVGDATRAYTWEVPEAGTVFVRVDDGVSVGCGEASGTLRLANRDDRAHALTVRVRDGDAVAFERTVELSAGGEQTIPAAVEESGRHVVAASTAEGASATGDWWVCPPVARKLVQVHERGGIVIGSTGLS